MHGKGAHALGNGGRETRARAFGREGCFVERRVLVDRRGNAAVDDVFLLCDRSREAASDIPVSELPFLIKAPVSRSSMRPDLDRGGLVEAPTVMRDAIS